MIDAGTGLRTAQRAIPTIRHDDICLGLLLLSRQSPQGSMTPGKFIEWNRWRAHYLRVVGDILQHSTLRSNLDAVTNLEMP